MPRFPASIENLIQEFKRLPGIGEKTAERFVFHLLGRGRRAPIQLADALYALDRAITSCSECRSVSESDPCRICRDPARHPDEVCIVADQQGLSAIERTGAFKGRYFVLGGLLSPIEGVTPESLGIEALDARLRGGTVRELLMASTFGGRRSARSGRTRRRPARGRCT